MSQMHPCTMIRASCWDSVSHIITFHDATAGLTRNLGGHKKISHSLDKEDLMPSAIDQKVFSSWPP